MARVSSRFRTPDTRICTVCCKVKSLDEFCIRTDYRSGIATKCRECDNARGRIWKQENIISVLRRNRTYNKTRGGKIMMAFHNIRGRVTGIQRPKTYVDKGVKILPRRVFYKWALGDEGFNKLFAEWSKSGYKRSLSPSLSRKDPKAGYALGNMKWVTQSEISRLRGLSDRRKHAVK